MRSLVILMSVGFIAFAACGTSDSSGDATPRRVTSDAWTSSSAPTMAPTMDTDSAAWEKTDDAGSGSLDSGADVTRTDSSITRSDTGSRSLDSGADATRTDSSIRRSDTGSGSLDSGTDATRTDSSVTPSDTGNIGATGL